jgi:hypothetical protein
MSPFAPGAVIAGRYELGHLLADDGLTAVWDATDRVLARRVVIEALSSSATGEAAEAFAAAATAAGRLIHPGIAATYDSGSAEGVAYIVTERPSGSSLADVLERQGPLAPARIVDIGRQLGRAVDAAHRQGVAHGGISPATVMLADDDRVKLGRFAAAGARSRLEAAAAGETVGGGAGGGGQRADVRACGTTLAAAVRQTGLPRSLGEALGAAADGTTQTAGDLVRALEAIDLADDAVPLVEREPTPPLGVDARRRPPPVRPPGSRTGAAAGVVVGLLLVIAIGVAAFVLTSSSGSGGGGGGSGQTTTPGQGSANLAVTGAVSFNPLGSGPEDTAAVANLYDGNPATVWSTETYATRRFGNLKAGDGVYLTLPAARAIHEVTVTSPSPGWVFSVYIAAQPASALAGWGQPVAGPTTVSSTDTTVQLRGAHGAAVLIWMTELTAAPPFRVDIGEITLH